MKNKNLMIKQTFGLPKVMKFQYSDLDVKIKNLFSVEDITRCDRIILTGCGDSFAAALALSDIFELLTDIPTQAIPTLDVARYLHPKQIGKTKSNPLVILISQSGNVARVNEAAQFVNQCGGTTLGITTNLDSSLCKIATKILKLDIPDVDLVVGVKPYMASLIALFLIAVHFGEVLGKYNKEKSQLFKNDIIKQSEQLEDLLPKLDEDAKELANKWKDKQVYDFVGAGFDYAAAFYGYAKLLEATGKPGMLIDTEQWLHLNVFAKDIKSIGTLMVANTTNPAITRVREVIKCSSAIGRSLVIITNGKMEDFNVEATYFSIPQTETHISIPLTQFVPLALIIGHLSDFNGEKYKRGYEGPWEVMKNETPNTNSEIYIRKGVLK